MTKFAKIIHKNKENFLIKKFTALFKRKIKDKKKGRISFVLTGGKSPIKLYRHLSNGIKLYKIISNGIECYNMFENSVKAYKDFQPMDIVNSNGYS